MINRLSLRADAARDEGSNQIMIVAPKAYDAVNFRKILEVACWGKGLRLGVFSRGGRKGAEGAKRRDRDE